MADDSVRGGGGHGADLGHQGPARMAGPLATVVAAVLALIVLAVYRATMLPGVGAWDTAEAQVVPTILGTMHPTGFPAYVILGWLATTIMAPFAEPAAIMNFLSGLLVAFAMAGSVFVMRRLGAPPLLAGAVALALGLTPIIWTIALSADAHALHLALVVLVTLGLLRWEDRVRAWRADPGSGALRASADRAIVTTAAVFGVALANHALSLLLIPAIGLFVLATDRGILLRPKVVAAAIGACLGVAAVLYLQLPLRAGPFRAPLVYGSPETWTGFWDIVLARQFQGDIAGPLQDLPNKLSELYDLAAQQFGVLLLLLPVAFVVTAVRHPRYALLTATAVAITWFFASSYANARIDRYYLGPAFFAWTWFAVLGGAIVAQVAGTGSRDERASAFRPSRRRRIGSPVLPASVVVSLALGTALLVPTVTQLRDRWSDVDVSGVTWVATWLDESFQAFEEDAVVISWWSYSTPLWYGQHAEGRRKDIWIVDDRTRIDEDLGEVTDVIEANLGRRPVYLIRQLESEIQTLRERYTIESLVRPGNVYRVTGRQESSQ